MTIEQILERVLTIARVMPIEERKYYQFAETHPRETVKDFSAGTMLYFLTCDLREQIAFEGAKKSRRKSEFNAAMRICRRAISYAGGKRPYHAGAWIDDEGKQCFCDGFTGVRLNSALDLPPAPEPKEDEQRIDLAQTISPARENSIALTLPLAADLRAKIKAEHAEWKASKPPKGASFISHYDFGPNLPRVNTRYLLDVIELFPKCKIYVNANSPLLSPLYVKDRTGEAILLPVRKSSDD